MKIKEGHIAESHAKKTYKKLKAKHKFALLQVVPVGLHCSIQHLVRNEQLQVISFKFCSVQPDGSIGSFQFLKDVIWFKTATE
jgi:hypothetical protein